jgi:hypothetical protein
VREVECCLKDICVFYIGRQDFIFEEWCLLGCYAMWVLCEPEVPDELSASFIRVTKIGEIGTTLAVTSNRRTLRRNTKCVGC